MTLKSPLALADAGLIAPERAASLAAVAERYAVAVTDTVAALDRPRRFARPHRPPIHSQRRRTRDDAGRTRRSHRRRRPFAGPRHRASPQGPRAVQAGSACPVYCRFCFRREMVGPEGETALSPRAFETALAYIAAHPRNLGSDPHRRRPLHSQCAPRGGGEPPPRRHPTCEDHPLAHPRAGRRSRRASPTISSPP